MAKVFTYITGTVDEELLLRNEYLAAENRIMMEQLKGRLRLTDPQRKTLAEIGYPEAMTQKVQDLNLKRNFPADENSRVLEDALCLVFLERQLADLAAKASEEKVLNALKKSWKKMTPRARSIALELQLPELERGLIEKALAPGRDSGS